VKRAFLRAAAFLFSPWAKHDGHTLAKIMADGVDFVIVAATYRDLRADFEKRRVRLPERALEGIRASRRRGS